MPSRSGRRRGARLEMAVHLPRSGHRRRQSAGHPGRNSGRISAHLGDGDEFVLRAAARQPDLHDGRHDHAPQPAGGQAGRVSRLFGKFQRRRLFRDALHRQRRCRPAISTPGSSRRAAPDRRSTMPATPNWQSRARPCRPRPTARSSRTCSSASSTRRCRVPERRRRRGLCVRRCARREVDMLGKLSWAAIPFNEPLPLISAAVVVIVILAVLVTRHRKGLVALSVARVADQRRSQAHRRHVRGSRARHAAARLFRRDHDAHAAGDRGRRRPGIPAARSLRPDLLGARHDHDLLRGDAARHRADELCRAVAARRARRRLSGAQFGQLLAHRVRRAADQPSLVIGNFARTGWWAIRRFPSSPFRPMSASIITFGHCRSRASARCSPASIS